MRHSRYYVALAFTVSFALPAGWAFAHSYDNQPTGHPEKTLDGPTTVSPGNENGVDGYWVEYTRFTYQDISEDYYNVELSLEDLEKAYCKQPHQCGNNDTTSINCTAHPAGTHQSQDQLYSGAVSPHAQGMRYPQDKQEFASFLSAATGNYNNGQGGNLAQANAKAGTRLAQIQDQKAFDAAAARMYAFQFAAAAKGYDPSTADGIAKGAIAFYQMAPAAQEFMQVAAIYKGNFAANNGNYNNNALKNLLPADLSARKNVGNTDVETLGAVAAALDRDAIQLEDIANSNAIGDRAKYAKAIDAVNSGTFALKLAEYDRTAFNAGNNARGNLNANIGNAGFNAPGAAKATADGGSVGKFYQQFATAPNPSRVAKLAESDPVYRKLLELHDINGQGRIYGEGEVTNYVSSMRAFMEALQDGDRAVAGVPVHDGNHIKMFDANGDGALDDTELLAGLKKTEAFNKAVVADAADQSGGLIPGGGPCGAAPPPPPAPTPPPATPPPPPVKPPGGGYGG